MHSFMIFRQANPGPWTLGLREGRSKDLYNITSPRALIERGEKGEEDVIILVNSFTGYYSYVRMRENLFESYITFC